MSKMMFESLKIEYSGWSSDRKLEGRVRFCSKEADVYLNIDATHCQTIMDMCAGALVDTAKDMSEVMRSNIIEGMSLEKKVTGFIERITK